MSLVTNVVLFCGLRDEEKVRKLPIDFLDVGMHFGGPKVCEAGVFGCAANYLDEEKLMEAITSIAWEQPEQLQVMVKRQEEDVFTFWLAPIEKE